LADSASTPILRIGEATPVSEQGTLVNPCRADLVFAPWREAVDMLVRLCRTAWGESLHSLYLRGSVPRGTAVEHRSDIDTVCVLTAPPSSPVATQAAHIARTIRLHYPFCVAVDLRVIAYQALMDPYRSANLRFLLKTQGLCIEGEDLTARWAPPTLSEARMTLRALPAALAATRTSLAQQPGPPEAAGIGLCRWVTKKIVRAGFERVAERERTYTRDLYPCWEAFARHTPQMAQPMYEVLALAVNPCFDAARIRDALLVGDRVVQMQDAV